MDSFIDFISFQNPNVRYVALGSLLLTASSAIVGCFTFLKKKALVGDAVAHSVLPGICLAFMLAGTKNPLILIGGAFLTGWLSLLLIDWVTSRSKIKEDTAIALTLSVFFGIGILLLTYIQHSGNAAQSGLDSFLFGKAASLVGSDLWTFLVIAIGLITTVILFFKELTLIAFNPDFARSIGFPVRGLELLLTTLTVLAVVAGIQAVGVVLMAAMLITPAAAARFWTDKIQVMVGLAAAFGALSGLAGAYISYVAPAMPTGPWIVVVITLIALFSFFFAPGKGVVAKWLISRGLQVKILEENLLKLMYHLGENEQDNFWFFNLDELWQKRPSYSKQKLRAGLQRLLRKELIKETAEGYSFTEKGFEKGKRIVRLHRLWELYLSEYLRIAPDHVHEDAETMEHIITPEIEKELETRLHYPSQDPHEEEIPR